MNNKTSGTIILTIIGLIAVLSLFTLAGTSFLRNQTQGAAKYEKSLRANYVAKAGLQLALEQLHLDANWGSSSTPTVSILDVSDDGHLQAKVSIWSNVNGTTSLVGPNSVSIPTGAAYIQSVGIVAGEEYHSSFGSAGSLLVRPDVEMNYGERSNFHARANAHQFLS